MMTKKANEEFDNLNSKINYLDKELNDIMNSSIPYNLKMKERNSLQNKKYKLEERVDKIKKFGVSPRELGSIKKELSGFVLLTSDRSLGSRNFTKIGLSTILNSYIKIKGVRYSGFMSNVRGMGSLANTTEIDSIELLSKEEYENLKKQDAIIKTSFAGATETKIIKR